MLPDLESDPSRYKSGTTFEVDPVTPAERLIWTETLADSLSRRFARKIFVLANAQQQVINANYDDLKGRRLPKLDVRDIGSRCHPLIEAVHVAFSQHRPLSLSPDSIWLTLAHGFSHHVAANAETLRPRLIRHQGRRELAADCNDLSLASFEQAVAAFSSQIRSATDPVLHETLICDFSTTTPPIRTASEVAIMDSFSSYFTYYLRCICGIPKITLQGTVQDWQRIRARVEVLETYGLNWWISRLRPILDEFVHTAAGHPEPEFWKAIYKPVKAYGDAVATGWITDLFPYLGDAPDRRRNHVLNHERRDWALLVDNGVETKTSPFGPLSRKGVGLGTFPSGVSSARLAIRMNGTETDLDLVAGFFGVEQNASDLTLSPVIGWSVTAPPPQTPVLI